MLVIGTRHEFQRHQDTAEDRAKVRAEFDGMLRRLLKERVASLIAEEAGDDKEVWEHLKKEEDAIGVFVEAFGGGRTVAKPVPTIAKTIADGHFGQVRHADIRADAKRLPQVEQRDEAMAFTIMQIIEPADSSLLVIVGEEHRAGVSQRLAEQGLLVESFSFPTCGAG